MVWAHRLWFVAVGEAEVFVLVAGVVLVECPADVTEIVDFADTEAFALVACAVLLELWVADIVLCVGFAVDVVDEGQARQWTL